MIKVHPAQRREYCHMDRCKLLVEDLDLHLQTSHNKHYDKFHDFQCKYCIAESVVVTSRQAALNHVRLVHSNIQNESEDCILILN